MADHRDRKHSLKRDTLTMIIVFIELYRIIETELFDTFHINHAVSFVKNILWKLGLKYWIERRKMVSKLVLDSVT